MFTTYASAPKIEEESTRENDGAVFYVGDEARRWGRTNTRNRYRKVGLTKAAADSGVAAIFSPTVNAAAKRMDAVGHWQVDVDSFTRGNWELET